MTHPLPPLDGSVSQGHVPAQDGIQGGGQLPSRGHELLLSVPEKLQGHLPGGRQGQLLHQGNTAAPSAASRFINFSRAGCCRRGPAPPGWCPAGSRQAPGKTSPSMVRAVPSWAPPMWVSSSTRATAAMAAKASPRKPRVPMAARSLGVRSLLVAWRRKAVWHWSAGMPLPSSVTGSWPCLPLDLTVTPGRRHHGVFTSSFTTEAGRFHHLPAAMSRPHGRGGLEYHAVLLVAWGFTTISKSLGPAGGTLPGRSRAQLRQAGRVCRRQVVPFRPSQVGPCEVGSRRSRAGSQTFSRKPGHKSSGDAPAPWL